MIVARVDADGDGKPDRNYFGVFKRHDDRSAPYPLSDVWQWIHRGHSPSPSIEARDGAEMSKTADIANQILSMDRKAMLTDEHEALLAIQIAPEGVEKIKRFFSGDTDAVFDAFRSFVPLRDFGFHFPINREPTRAPWGGLGVAIPGHSGISVSRSGVVTVIASQSLLTWGSDQMFGAGQLCINPLAMIEFVFEASRFFCEYISRHFASQSTFQWRCDFRDVEGSTPLKLPRFRFQPHSVQFPENLQSASNFTTDWTGASSRDAAKIAFEIVDCIYGAFGLGSDCIPFSLDEQIDATAIRRAQ